MVDLISPVGSDFLKNWPAQNAINSELLDAYAGPYAIQSYVPVLSATTTPPVLGTTNAFIVGFYYRLFDQIFTWGEFRFGTGFNKGSGTYTISLPFEANSLIAANTGTGGGPTIGEGQVYDDSLASARQPVGVQLRTSTTIQFTMHHDTGFANRAVDGLDNPITWAALDSIQWTARYQRLLV
jgi:hypothetical protein